MGFESPVLQEKVIHAYEKSGGKLVILAFAGPASILQVKTAAASISKVLSQFPDELPVIDLLAVSEVDVAFMQLLISIARLCRPERKIFLAEVPDDHPLAKSARLAGIVPENGSWFGLSYPGPVRLNS